MCNQVVYFDQLFGVSRIEYGYQIFKLRCLKFLCWTQIAIIHPIVHKLYSSLSTQTGIINYEELLHFIIRFNKRG